MKQQKFVFSANIPEEKDFLAKYQTFNNLIKTNDAILVFKLIMTPENLLRCQIATEFGMPAVTAIAEECRVALKNQKKILKNDLQLKQFIGAVVCVLMEANGYKKSNNKKRIPHESFTRGEFYIK